MMRKRRSPKTTQKSKFSVKQFGKFEGVYSIDGRLAMVNFLPGVRVYGEDLGKILIRSQAPKMKRLYNIPSEILSRK